jgi:hypothetical protein
MTRDPAEPTVAHVEPTEASAAQDERFAETSARIGNFYKIRRC